MKRVRVFVNVLIFGGGFALLGAMYTADGPWEWYYGAVVLGVVGVIFGAAVGGSRFAADLVYGPRKSGRP
jgi:hypothetical protein